MATTKHKARPELDKINTSRKPREQRDPQYQRLVDRAVAAIDRITDEDSSPFWDAMDKLNVYQKMKGKD